MDATPMTLAIGLGICAEWIPMCGLLPATLLRGGLFQWMLLRTSCTSLRRHPVPLVGAPVSSSSVFSRENAARLAA